MQRHQLEDFSNQPLLSPNIRKHASDSSGRKHRTPSGELTAITCSTFPSIHRRTPKPRDSFHSVSVTVKCQVVCLSEGWNHAEMRLPPPDNFLRRFSHQLSAVFSLPPTSQRVCVRVVLRYRLRIFRRSPGVIREPLAGAGRLMGLWF